MPHPALQAHVLMAGAPNPNPNPNPSPNPSPNPNQVHVLMAGAPNSIDTSAIERQLRGIRNVVDVHWCEA